MQLYHGPKRNATLKQLANADIVLTTFETVSSDSVASTSKTLRNISWFRIVLDEGKSPEKIQQAPSDG
jgi:SNF2 family DNA or RNA helicase